MVSSIPLKTVFSVLQKHYDPPRTFLHYKTPFQLLIATMLSAQCTDVMVNKVTKVLFAKYKMPKDFAKLRQADLEKLIKSTGFFRAKSRNVLALSHILLQEYGGKVPQTMAELVKLPGVGRKTDAIILWAAFGRDEGIAVDTHVIRLSQRLGLSKHKDPKKIEQDLMADLPRKDWGYITTLMISHGRAVCTARNRKCEECIFKKKCPSSLVMQRRDLVKK